MNDLLLIAITLAGHVGIWVAAYNQMNAFDLPRVLKKTIEKLMIVAVIVMACVLIAARFPWGPLDSIAPRGISASMWGGYALVSWLFLSWVAVRWIAFRLRDRRRRAEWTGRRQWVDVARELGRVPAGDTTTRWAARIPGNQIFKLDQASKEISIPELPACWDGLKIAHLSDLHMTGEVDRSYFEALVDWTNNLHPDLVVITGDLVDKRRCLNWVEPVLSRLESRFGVYAVLGNHDRRVRDEAGLSKRLKRAGVKRLNGRWESISARHGTLWLAGNELPWFKGAERLKRRPEAFDRERDACILLTHTPDQFAWARRRSFDLVLAGHCHGGQIRVPLIGAIVVPSRHGVKYASGYYREGSTVMHISRGLSGVHPIRLNCPPELPLLTIRSRAAGMASRRPESAAREAPSDEQDLKTRPVQDAPAPVEESTPV